MPRGNVGMLGSTPMLNHAIQTAQPQQSTDPNATPSWYNTKESAWQNSLDLADRERNRSSAYSNYAADQGNWIPDGQGGHTVDNSKMPPPAFNGPQGYGLNNVASGGDWGTSMGNDGLMNEQLAGIQKFDPNAKLERFDREAAGDGGNMEGHYRINYDQSKMPKPAFDAQQGGNWQLAGPQGQNVINQSAMRVDPNYGIYTPTQNVKQDSSWVDTIGQYAPLVMAMMTGGMGMIPTLGRQVLSGIRGVSEGQGINPMQVGSAVMPFLSHTIGG